ncbi:MAG: prepilin-type N-terminal cleavage/methylation domain-containing protein [Minisyncoccales bacterium]
MKFQFPIFKKCKSFTLIEVLVIIAVIIILCAITANVYSSFRSHSELNTSSEKILSALRLSQSKTLSSEGASEYGVHFEQDKIVLFKGNVYDALDSNNERYDFSSRIEISNISFNGGGTEIIFDRISGTTSEFGTVKLELKKDPNQFRVIVIASSGEASIQGTAVPLLGTRITDSRHIHFVYDRNIDTINEIITLTFSDPATVESIKISDFIIGGQFDWEGTVTVGTDDQLIHIHTHWLNNPDTMFCIHRDRRYNNKSLTVSISGEAGTLISYTADGIVEKGDSIYVVENSLELQ